MLGVAGAVLGPGGQGVQIRAGPTQHWQRYVVPIDGERKGKWPDFDFVVVSADTAFTKGGERSHQLHYLGRLDRTGGRLSKDHAHHVPAKASADHGEPQEPQERGESVSPFAIVLACADHSCASRGNRRDGSERLRR
jgi:hypothetical protein